MQGSQKTASKKREIDIINLTYRWDGERTSLKLRKPKVLIALQPRSSQGLDFSVGSMKMLNALLYATQCAISQEFGSRENFWRVFQMNPGQDLSMTIGTAELSHFMWGTRRRVAHRTFEQLANTLKDLSYIQDEDSSLVCAKSHSVFGYVSVPKGLNMVTVTFRSAQCEAYFHPKALYSTLRLESMFSVRSLWTCFLLELGAKYSGHPNKVTKGRTIKQWCERAKGSFKNPCRIDNVHRSLRLACKEVDSIFNAGLCGYTVKLRKARTRLVEGDLLRFEAVQEPAIKHAEAKRSQVDGKLCEVKATCSQPAIAPDDEASVEKTVANLAQAEDVLGSGLMVALVERLKLKADRAREIIRTYGESFVQQQFDAFLAYLRQCPNTLRNPPGFFLRLLEGSVSLEGFGLKSPGEVCVESLSQWAIAQERKAQIERERAQDIRQREQSLQNREQRLKLLERFKGLPESVQQGFHRKVLEALNGNAALLSLVEGNRYHALVLKTFRESLTLDMGEECYNT